MTDQATTPAANLTPSFNLTRCYLKDASLELPNAPQIFLEQSTPESEISLNIDRTHLDGGFHEVTVQVTLSAKMGEKTLFLIEATQAGIFVLENVPEKDVAPLLEIVCAAMVHSYLRPNVADLINRSSLPPVYLADVDFQAFYQARVEAVLESAQATQQ
jgi:preprotein translocase subunit SecB